MPIGDQIIGDIKITEADLKKRYDDLIKEAILGADESLEITRADEVPFPGSITSDIITRIMHSDIVVADVTYPNPNVFYELGLRHACRAGTVIIRDKTGPSIPFDIAHLRHIQYDNTPTGLKALSSALRKQFDFFDENPEHPDNRFLEQAQLSHYRFPQYEEEMVSEDDVKAEFFMAALQSPKMMDLLIRKSSGEDVSDADVNAGVIKLLSEKPELASTFSKIILKSEQASKANIAKGKRQPKKK